ncbi:GvpL/GvpF family gas vesicle protein [Streptomyces catenulae]|uniref:GvpL/GvpF family gas vesicle protein n=1 Tax=Streptomyces catenulae TaxID=66875 RepID=A0ABV2YSS5_9ACTN|nr:GvpL/GvpF family gas vesicle protein [Streptomyces catenulae]
MTEAVTYAYAVARDDDGTLATELSGLSGVADAPVRLVRAGRNDGVVVAVSPVPAPDFREEALHAHLEDMEWLEAIARAHHRVIEAIAAHGTVLPLRLATVYLDEERVRLMLDDSREEFADRLAELAGLEEWGVKIYVEDAPGTEDPAAPSTGADLSPGRAYLSHRKAQRHAREDAYRAAQRVARDVAATARRQAVARAQHRPQQGELARGPGENVVNDAYLVPRPAAHNFRAAVLRTAEEAPGVRVEATGPWAPYSFAASLEAEPAKKVTP